MTDYRNNFGGDEEYFPELEAMSRSGIFDGKSQNFQRALAKQLIDSAWTFGKDACERAEARMGAIEAWLAMEPRDAFEAQVAANAVAANNAAMGCFQQGGLETLPSLECDMAMNRAIKLSDLHLRQLAAIDKHRGKGRQKITVEHVTVVENGGQAIVGNVERPAVAAPCDEIVLPPVIDVEATPVPPIRVRSRTRLQ
jgi:hypothetical protein